MGAYAVAKKKVKKKVPKTGSEAGRDEPGFEESLARLEEIASELEDGRIGLETALQRYEEGVGLLRRCSGLLNKAQRRIELLSGFDADGNPVTTPLDDDTLSLEEKAQNRSRRRTAASGSSGSGDEVEDDVDDSPLLF
jgi:exodeoxyribonuclease VII small subunit